MIIQKRPNGQLLCIYQTSHALMAAQFCRHWGNDNFAKPAPYEVVMAGIAQHDNGWYDWEKVPQVDEDGSPLSFLSGPPYTEKLPIWQVGIDRAAAQHPYMGLLVSRHATLLYAGDMQHLQEDERKATEAFVAKQVQWTNEVRRQLAADTMWQRVASEPVLMAHTRLLQFGDSASLQVAIPWSKERLFPHSPVDFEGNYTTITMRWEGQEIEFDPWPFGVDHFTVNLHGRLLDQSTFPNNDLYRNALVTAPVQTLTWEVGPAGLLGGRGIR